MILSRYTTLPVLLDTLIHKRITLLDPASWEDRNDSFYVEKYKELKGYKSILALCFTTKQETFHHWKIFSGNSSGVCIRFSKDKLLDSINKVNGIRYGFVKYKLIKSLIKMPPFIDELPYIKRKQYEDEQEFRIIYEDPKRSIQFKNIHINLESIIKITLSPWLPQGITKTIKNLISNIDGCNSIRLVRTGVVEYKAWKDIIKNIV